MKSTFKILFLGLVAVGMLTGCPKAEETPPEEPKVEEPTAEEPKVEEPVVEEPKVEEPAAEVDEAMYIKAAYEVTCVKAKIEDTETQKGILAEVYPRYGFTEETFGAAEKTMAETTSATEAVKSKMEGCTPEVAAAFKTAGADVEAKPEEVKKEEGKTEKKPAKAAVKDGKYNGAVTGGGLTDGGVKITVKDGGKTILAKFQGKREGSKFIIPMKGTIAKDGNFTMSGKKGQHTASAKGRFKGGVANARITGSVNKKGLNVTFTAK